LDGKKKKLFIILSNQPLGTGPVIHMFKKFHVSKEPDNSSSSAEMPTNELDPEPVIYIIFMTVHNDLGQEMICISYIKMHNTNTDFSEYK
jgi:hypothetical protein